MAQVAVDPIVVTSVSDIVKTAFETAGGTDQVAKGSDFLSQLLA
jgi:hypothetical protein